MTCERCDDTRWPFLVLTLVALGLFGLVGYFVLRYDATKTCVVATYRESSLEVCGYNLERRIIGTPAPTPDVPDIYKKGEQ